MHAHSHMHQNKLTELCKVLAKETETVGALVARDKAADRCLSSPAAECHLASWLWITGKSRNRVLVSQQDTGYWSVNKTQGTGQSTRHRVLVSQQDTGYWSINKTQGTGQSTRHRVLVSQQDTGYWSTRHRELVNKAQGTGQSRRGQEQEGRGTGQSTRHKLLVNQQDTRYWSINKRTGLPDN